MPKYPPELVAVEYDFRGKRVSRVFANHYEARRFYTAKDKANKRPKVKKVNRR